MNLQSQPPLNVDPPPANDTAPASSDATVTGGSEATLTAVATQVPDEDVYPLSAIGPSMSASAVALRDTLDRVIAQRKGMEDAQLQATSQPATSQPATSQPAASQDVASPPASRSPSPASSEELHLSPTYIYCEEGGDRWYVVTRGLKVGVFNSW